MTEPTDKDLPYQIQSYLTTLPSTLVRALTACDAQMRRASKAEQEVERLKGELSYMTDEVTSANLARIAELEAERDVFQRDRNAMAEQLTIERDAIKAKTIKDAVDAVQWFRNVGGWDCDDVISRIRALNQEPEKK